MTAGKRSEEASRWSCGACGSYTGRFVASGGKRRGGSGNEISARQLGCERDAPTFCGTMARAPNIQHLGSKYTTAVIILRHRPKIEQPLDLVFGPLVPYKLVLIGHALK